MHVGRHALRQAGIITAIKFGQESRHGLRGHAVDVAPSRWAAGRGAHSSGWTSSNCGAALGASTKREEQQQ